MFQKEKIGAGNLSAFRTIFLRLNGFRCRTDKLSPEGVRGYAERRSLFVAFRHKKKEFIQKNEFQPQKYFLFSLFDVLAIIRLKAVCAKCDSLFTGEK